MSGIVSGGEGGVVEMEECIVSGRKDDETMIRQ